MAVTLRATKGSRLTHAEMDENWKSVMGGHNFLHIQDQKPQGTNGGTFTAGAWRTRDLNTVLTNTISGASLAANQITLPAGKYYVEASAPAYWVTRCKARLQDVSNNLTLLVGFSEYNWQDTSCYVQTRSEVYGIFEHGGAINLEVQHQSGVSSETNGFGHATNYATEVYSDIRIWRIGEYVAP